MKVLEYNVDQSLPDWPITDKIVVNTLNPHSYCVSKKDILFFNALQSSDYLFPDGIGIVMASKFLNNMKIARITGADIHNYFLQIAQKYKLRIFYLGASDETLNKINERIKAEYPDIVCSYYSPPFKQFFSKKDNEIMIDEVNHFLPDILFVGMTAPKQEKWVFENKEKIQAKVLISIGAVFDFYAGRVKRAPNYMIKLGLEWFYRLVMEPKRMWRRYLINNFIFLKYVMLQKINNN